MANAKRSVGEESKPRRLAMDNGKVKGLELRRLSFDFGAEGLGLESKAKTSPRSVSLVKSKETSRSSDNASHVCRTVPVLSERFRRSTSRWGKQQLWFNALLGASFQEPNTSTCLQRPLPEIC